MTVWVIKFLTRVDVRPCFEGFKTFVTKMSYRRKTDHVSTVLRIEVSVLVLATVVTISFWTRPPNSFRVTFGSRGAPLSFPFLGMSCSESFKNLTKFFLNSSVKYYLLRNDIPMSLLIISFSTMKEFSKHSAPKKNWSKLFADWCHTTNC